ncbi:hypothetical protein EBU71_21380, partial [bacterium]|nr:hypothetical protein [Candidatus Elulimicrobium humile]
LTNAGNYNGAGIRMWESHDSSGGELIIDSPNRIALINSGAIQIGDNSTADRAMHPLLTSGYASASRPLRHSPAVSFQTSVWKNNDNLRKPFIFQAVPLNTEEVVVKGFFDGTIVDENYRPPLTGYSQNSGLASGTLGFELTSSGLWTPGTSPQFTTATQTTNLIINCDKHKTFQNHSAVISGNRTLVFTGLEEGMRGTIVIKQDGTGGRTLTLPGGALSESGFGLTATPLALDRIEWVYTPLGLVFSIVKNLSQTLDGDVQAFLSYANITDTNTTNAINSLVVSLKINSLWDKLHVLYPFVGGNASSNSKNLKGNLNHITWNGTLTHNSNGVTGNGTNGWGSSAFKFSSVSGSKDSSFAYVYSKTQNIATNNFYFIGAVDSTFDRIGIKTGGGGAFVVV